MNNEKEKSELRGLVLELKDNLTYIGNQYGIRNQLKRVQSEIFELSEAIINYENTKDSIYTQDFDELRIHVVEEFADVFNMYIQILLLYDIKPRELIRMMRSKVFKQLNKMKDLDELRKTIDNL